jgi:phospholipase C
MRPGSKSKTLRHKLASCVALGAMTIHVLAPMAAAEAQTLSPLNGRTPIKHLIVVIGENRSFDNVFATYVPPAGQSVWNLLSQGIVQADGKPGPNAGKAAQRKAVDNGAFQLAPPPPSAPDPIVFPALPQPSTTLNALPGSPCTLSQLIFSSKLFCTDIGLLPTDYLLLSKGGTGQSFYFPALLDLFPVPDCRYPSNLPNAPYSLVDASKLNNCPPVLKIFDKPVKDAIVPTAYTDNTGDPVHRFFQMWQQNDCSAASITPINPSGCLHDLYTWVATSVGWQITKDGTSTPPPQPPLPEDDQATFQGGIAMGFYNMAKGDYPYFQSLAQKYAISDNYHQPVMGGTGANSQFLLTGDVFYFTDANGNAAMPPPNLTENPDPQAGSNNYYTFASPNISIPPPSFFANGGDPGNTSTGGLVNCSDPSQHGVAAILDYLGKLPYRPKSNCEAGHYYQVDNEYPYYTHDGTPAPGWASDPNIKNEFPAGATFAIGPQTIPTIGDSLSAAHISWKYYGEGITQAADAAPGNTLYCAICNAFQYSKSIMTSSLESNLQDLNSFFNDVKAGTLPSVSFIKPDILLDSHPGTSTPPLYEAFTQNIIQAVQQNPSLWQDTAILITFDESGGYYDSGYIQPIDFFGDGPRTVLIAVSPFAKTGFVDHTYTDHASILKFIERNWGLKPLSPRSRDNLPNPVLDPWRPYFPVNSPAIGDLMEMFQFPVTNPVASHDFNGDHKSDIAWRDGSGNVAIWLMSGATSLSSGGVGGAPLTWSIVGQRDFDGDGKADLLWRDTSGNTAIWFMNGTQLASSAGIGNIPSTWSVVATGDFNGDSKGDIVWRDTNGDLAVWLMNGATVMSSVAFGNVPVTWTVVGAGDFNGDGFADLLWRDTLGNVSIWFMDGTTVVSTAAVGNVPATWSVAGTGDFNGDSMTDIVWRDTLGNTAIWLMNGPTVSSTGSLGLVPTTNTLVLTGDFNGDGMSDLLWRDNLGNTSMWFMNGTAVASTGAVGNIPTNWTVQSTNAE